MIYLSQRVIDMDQLGVYLGYHTKKLYYCKDCHLVTDYHACPECDKDIRKERIKFLKKK